MERWSAIGNCSLRYIPIRIPSQDSSIAIFCANYTTVGGWIIGADKWLRWRGIDHLVKLWRNSYVSLNNKKPKEPIIGFWNTPPSNASTWDAASRKLHLPSKIPTDPKHALFSLLPSDRWYRSPILLCSGATTSHQQNTTDHFFHCFLTGTCFLISSRINV